MTDTPTRAASGIFGRTGLTRLHAGLLAFGFAPLLLLFFANLWERAYYQFFPMALAGAGFLAWNRLKDLPRPLAAFAAGRGAGTAALVGGSFAILSVAMVLWSPWLASLAAVLMLVGAAWALGGWKVLRALLPALVLVLTIIPPPLALDARLMLYLRGLAVQGSSRLLDSLSVVHFLNGNVIELPQQKLLVEEACSGINSVLLTLAAGLFYLLWRRRSVLRFLVVLPVALSGVLIGNILRITLGAWLKYHHIVDILSGWRHELLGLVLVALYLSLIYSLDKALDFLAAPMWAIEAALPDPLAPAPVAAPALAAAGGSPRWLRAAVWAFALLGVAQLGRGWLHHHQNVAFQMTAPSALRAGAVFTLPEQVGDWRRLDAAQPLYQVEIQGVTSKIWHYQKGSTVASVALDYPFRGYHDVTICYRNNGWNIVRQERQAGTNAGPPLMVVELEQAPVSQGSLWFSTVDEQGHWMETPVLQRSLLDRLGLTGGFGFVPTSYRMQVLVSGYGPLPPAARDAARDLFEAVRASLARQLFEQLPPKP